MLHSAPNTAFRVETDSLGEVEVPGHRLYGAQTARAVLNFPLSGIPISRYPSLLIALARVKQAAALTNAAMGRLARAKADAIVAAAEDVVAGRLDEHFPVDVFQGGAGTSTNMNMNEVLANRGLELLGQARGHYIHLHPNDDVNLSQSTNDAYPTAVRIAVLLASADLHGSLRDLAGTFDGRGQTFAHVVKLGRTQLQDAVPMTLGQEMHAYAATLREDLQRLAEACSLLHEVNLGGTAIGTRINAPQGFGPRAIEELARLTGFPLVQSANLVEASWDMGGFVAFSGILKRIAVKLGKIANDLRLLSSGPRGGLNEIALPPMQPGSSIMPGKVNPVIAEALNQICFQVIGNDLAVTLAADAGQLQLNAFEPLIAHNVLQSLSLLARAVALFDTRLVAGIEAREEVCSRHVLASVGTATALVPLFGYERSAAIAKEALRSGRSVRDVARDTLDVGETELDRVLSLEALALSPTA